MDPLERWVIRMCVAHRERITYLTEFFRRCVLLPEMNEAGVNDRVLQSGDISRHRMGRSQGGVVSRGDRPEQGHRDQFVNLNPTEIMK